MATDNTTRSHRLLVVSILLAAIAAIAVAALLVNVFQRKQEARNLFYRVVEIDNTTEDPAVWGKDFPNEYDLYQRTSEMKATKYGGSEAVAHTPTDSDPRTTVTREKIELDPRLKEMWAGYAFSVDYREKRGHAYMLDDQTYTERQKFAKQPGTCLNCHASLYTVFMQQGNGDLTKGFEAVNHMPYAEARKLAKHPVGCIDCHDPKTMSLRITRPAFIEGIRAYKATLGVKDFDVNTQATRQEMRAYVCAQCHVEYYFKGPEKRLTFPWDKGLKVQEITQYYDEIGFKDFVHAQIGVNELKAQHPEFETWSQGIHARSGVTCADCHMPYTREGGLKISDHNVRSPLLNINRSCQGCHRWSEQELKDRVEQIQTRFSSTRNLAMDALMDLTHDIKAAKDAGASDAELEKSRQYERDAQFYVDFIISENSMGFHADQYSIQTLAEAIDLCRKGQLALGTRRPAEKVQQAALKK